MPEMSKKERELNPKEQAFIREYVKDFNGTKAATRAGYSAKTANEQGARLLAKVSIQNALSKMTEQFEEDAELKVKDLQRHLRKIIEAKVTDFIHFNESGVSFVKNSDEFPPEVAGVLQSITVVENHSQDGNMTLRSSVKLHDKLKAIELYGKTIGAFLDRVEHLGNGPVIIMLPEEDQEGKVWPRP